VTKPGEARLRAALRRFRRKRSAGMPKPSSDWEEWVEYRLLKLEESQRWMLWVILSALIVEAALEVLRIL
jgi:hypothetical protein